MSYLVVPHRRPRVRTDGDTKYCADCKAPFPVEYNARGQMTSRILCDACRLLRATRSRAGADLPGIPEDTPRCVSCACLIGLDMGSSQTHLDSAGRCPSCARWDRRRGAAA